MSIGRAGQRVAVMVVAVAFAFPLYWVLVTAFNTHRGVFSIPPDFVPAFHFGPFTYVLTHTAWLHYMLNTVVIAGATVLLVLVTSAMAGYALADLRFRGSAVVFLLVIGVMLLPTQALLVPQYVIAARLHLLNTFAIQIVPFAASTFGVFLFRQFFKSIPRAYWEAARLDGASHLAYIRQVALPLARPAVATVALLTFITAWNQFQWPLIMTSSKSVQPIELALSHYMATYSNNWRELTAAAVIALVPVLIIFALTQRYMVRAVVGEDRGVTE